jgi:hypothetical protein
MKRVIMAALAAAVLASVSMPLSAAEPAYGFKFSGFFKTDAAWDNARIYPGDYRLWVVQADEKNDEFFMTANETRLGFDFWWKEDSYTTKAKLEFDFYGAAPAENKSQPMLRHAYVSMEADSWALLFGQTWDIISPLNPKTVNYSVNWDQGNIGYRRPQMRVTLKMKPGEKADLKLDAGISRNIGNNLDKDALDDGADSGIPTVQGRLGLGVPMGSEGRFAIGVSGHYGQEKYSNDESDTPSWSLNGDLTIKINRRVTLLGEFFTGEDLSQYLGGIGQGVNPLGDPLPSMGGWGQIQIGATDKMSLNLGYTFDDPDNTEWKVPDDGETYTLKDLNSEAYGNVMYSLTGNVSLMFEVAYMQTKYTAKTYGEASTSEDCDAMRFQFAVKAAIK